MTDTDTADAPAASRPAGIDSVAAEPAVAAWQAYHRRLLEHPALAALPVDACRHRARGLFGLDAEAPAVAEQPPTTAAVLGYAEQFLVDANGVDQAMGRPLKQALGDTGLVLLTVWLGVLEAECRLELLFGGASPVMAPELPPRQPSARPAAPAADPSVHPWPDETSTPQPSVQELLDRVAPEVAALRARVGPAVGTSMPPRAYELTRLISANSVACRYCQNVRITDAAGTPLIEESEIARHVLGSHDPEAPQERLALTAARAFHALPTRPDPALVQALRSQPPAVRADLGVTLLRNPAGSKAMIALGLVPESTPLTLL